MNLTLHTYRLPFRRPFRAGGRQWTERRGLLIGAEHGEIAATGEAAPLAGFSRETLEETREQCIALAGPLKELLTGAESAEELDAFHREQRTVPSLQFAVDTLWTGLRCRAGDITPSGLLFPDPPVPLRVNAVLADTDQERAQSEAARFVSSGYRTLKLKAGRDPVRFQRTVEAIRQDWPDVQIRIDANRGWNLTEAAEHLRRLAPLGIEYCEEPLAVVTAENYRTLESECEIPLALDETMSDSDFDRNLLLYIQVAVLKPMVIGSFLRLFATKRLLDDHDITSVVTTALEGAVGRTMAAVLAGGIGSADRAHGLSTGSVLKTDFCSEPVPARDGMIDPAAIRDLPEIQYGTIKSNITDRVAL